MRYELFLRRRQPLDEPLLARIGELLDDGSIPHDLLREGDAVLGVDLVLPIEDDQAADRLWSRARQLAAAADLAIYDPQLGRVIGENDQPAVARRIAEMRAFSEARPLDGAAPRPGSTPAARLWLAVVVALAALLLLGRLVLRCAL